MKQTANHASRQLGGCGMRREALLHLVSLLLSRPWATLGGEREGRILLGANPWQDGALMRNIRQLVRDAIISRLAARDKIHGG